MRDHMGAALGPAREPSNFSERLDNPPLWSPWNFQSKKLDWHEVIYDENALALYGEHKSIEP
jgi:hypothetical protein